MLTIGFLAPAHSHAQEQFEWRPRIEKYRWRMLTTMFEQQPLYDYIEADSSLEVKMRRVYLRFLQSGSLFKPKDEMRRLDLESFNKIYEEEFNDAQAAAFDRYWRWPLLLQTRADWFGVPSFAAFQDRSKLGDLGLNEKEYKEVCKVVDRVDKELLEKATEMKGELFSYYMQQLSEEQREKLQNGLDGKHKVNAELPFKTNVFNFLRKDDCGFSRSLRSRVFKLENSFKKKLSEENRRLKKSAELDRAHFEVLETYSKYIRETIGKKKYAVLRQKLIDAKFADLKKDIQDYSAQYLSQELANEIGLDEKSSRKIKQAMKRKKKSENAVSEKFGKACLEKIRAAVPSSKHKVWDELIGEPPTGSFYLYLVLP